MAPAVIILIGNGKARQFIISLKLMRALIKYDSRFLLASACGVVTFFISGGALGGARGNRYAENTSFENMIFRLSEPMGERPGAEMTGTSRLNGFSVRDGQDKRRELSRNNSFTRSTQKCHIVDSV